MGGNRERRQDEKRERDQQKKNAYAEVQRKKEDRLWEDDDKMLKRKEARKQEEEDKRAEAQRRKDEKQQLLQAEQEQLAKCKRAKDSVPKLTRVQIQQQLEKTAKAQAKVKAAENEPQDLLVENLNRVDEDEIAARGIDAAIAALDAPSPASSSLKADRHPERRAKAAWNAFFDRRLPEIKQERPGMRISQYREILWKEWQKHEDNPFNQEHVAYNEPKRVAPPPQTTAAAAGPSSAFPDFTDEELAEMNKRDIVELLQAHGPEDFKGSHNLGGLAKNVIKKKRQDELIAAYHDLKRLLAA